MLLEHFTKNWNKKLINNPDNEITTLKQHLEETQMQLMQDPQNTLLWMHKKDLQERIKQKAIEHEIY